MISKEIKDWLEKKGLKDDGKYFLNFIEEFWFPDTDFFGMKIRKDIEDFHKGRIEIWVDSYEYSVEEIRFFTKNPDWDRFRTKWDFKDVDAKTLDEIERIVKKKYVV